MNATPAQNPPPRCGNWFASDRQQRAFVEDLEHEFPRVPKGFVQSALDNACRFIHPSEGREELHHQVRRFLC